MKTELGIHAYKPFNAWLEFGLRMIGLWPNAPNAMVCRVFWFVSMAFAQICQYWYIVKHLKTDSLPDLMDNISASVTYSLMYFKFISLWSNRRIFYAIHKNITDEWNENVISGFDWITDILKNTITLSDRCSKSIITVFFFSVIFYATSIFVKAKDTGNEAISQERKQLLSMEFPFNSNISPIYEIIIVLQFSQQLTAATLGGMLNGLILTIILHLGGQIDIIRKKLMYMASNFSKGDTSSSLIINSLIQKHQKIIILSNDTERLFTYIALVQFLLNSLTICALGFLIVVTFGSVRHPLMLLKLLGFYAVITLEAFIYCFSGEYLGEKSKAIGDAAYESLWYELKPNESSILILIILRSQKRLTITIGKIMDLSLQRFTSILKASASYVSVLYAIY